MSKHLTTLLKQLRAIKTSDPSQIEHNLKQIKAIEKLQTDVRKALKQSGKIVVAQEPLSERSSNEPHQQSFKEPKLLQKRSTCVVDLVEPHKRRQT